MKDTDKFIELGSGHSYTFIENKYGERCGIIERHLDKDGTPCLGFVGFNGKEGGRGSSGKGPTWTVISMAPLTLQPSIRCTACDEHGYIHDGRWEPA